MSYWCYYCDGGYFSNTEVLLGGERWCPNMFVYCQDSLFKLKGGDLFNIACRNSKLTGLLLCFFQIDFHLLLLLLLLLLLSLL